MARVSTPDVSSVTMQRFIDAGLNAFALELLVESYANPARTDALMPLMFVWRGVEVSLKPYEAPAPERTWGDDPRMTVDLLLLAGVGYRALERSVTEEQMLATVQGWTREQREAAELWASAVHVHASDNDDVEVPEIPEHVFALGEGRV